MCCTKRCTPWSPVWSPTDGSNRSSSHTAARPATDHSDSRSRRPSRLGVLLLPYTGVSALLRPKVDEEARATTLSLTQFACRSGESASV